MFFPAIRFACVLLATLGLAACGDSGSGNAPKSAPSTASTSTPAPASGTPAAPAASGNAFEEAAKGSGFNAGNMMAVKQIYVFFDPQCPHCGHLWEAAKPLSNQLRMVWMPVGFIAPKSTTQGAALLAASDPVAAMDAHESSLLAKQGGMIPPDNLAADLTDKVKANTKLWQKLGGEAVPFVVFKNPQTGQAGTFAGSIDTEGLKKLAGI